MRFFKLRAGDRAQKLAEEWNLTEDELTAARVDVYYRRYGIILVATLAAYYTVFNDSGWWPYLATQAVS